jgi:hypothetical protein
MHLFVGNNNETPKTLIITVLQAVAFTDFQGFEFVTADFTISNSVCIQLRVSMVHWDRVQ